MQTGLLCREHSYWQIYPDVGSVQISFFFIPHPAMSEYPHQYSQHRFTESTVLFG